MATKPHQRTLFALLSILYMNGCGDDSVGTGTESDTASGTVASMSPSSTTLPASSTGDAESAGSSGGDEDTSTGDGILMCNPTDVDEPNNSENTATVLPNITDSDGDGDVVESILAGADDEDWFAYRGTDVAFAYVDPTGDLMADMQLRLCIFVECANGPTKPVTCQGSIDAESPDYRQGCCNTGAAPFVSIDLYCDANDDDSAFVFMRVDQGYENICTPYTIEYHF
ncbi:MAG: hypothetical protein R3A79_22430 [Nannocystaceae bacterium]